jgi:NitT/TauT family transport system ATP-binding protein
LVERFGAEMNLNSSIAVRNLSVSYRDQSALKGVTFEAHPGEFIVIVGPSGCGKSSLLLAIAGFIKSEGEIHAPERIGVVLQDYAVFPWLTVRGNIGFGLRHLPRKHRKRVIDEHLSLVDMDGYGDRYPSQLSGGQRQRVAVARAMAPDPDALLMDEPFGALDALTRARMQAWLLEFWAQQRKTVLFVTHDIEEAVFLSDRVLVLVGGVILDDVVTDFERPRTESLKYETKFQDARRRIDDRLRTGSLHHSNGWSGSSSVAFVDDGNRES